MADENADYGMRNSEGRVRGGGCGADGDKAKQAHRPLIPGRIVAGWGRRAPRGGVDNINT